MKISWRGVGFTQRKPREPGIYFIRLDAGHSQLTPPQNIRDGWDVAQVFFDAGSFSNAYDNREEFAHWRVESLGGICHAWRPGMWIKGPIKFSDLHLFQSEAVRLDTAKLLRRVIQLEALIRRTSDYMKNDGNSFNIETLEADLARALETAI